MRIHRDRWQVISNCVRVLTTFAYDDVGALRRSSGAGGTATFAYDGLGRVTTRTDAAGIAAFSYTSRGELYAATDPATGRTVVHTYNDASQLTGINYDDDDRLLLQRGEQRADLRRNQPVRPSSRRLAAVRGTGSKPQLHRGRCARRCHRDDHRRRCGRIDARVRPERLRVDTVETTATVMSLVDVLTGYRATPASPPPPTGPPATGSRTWARCAWQSAPGCTSSMR